MYWRCRLSGCMVSAAGRLSVLVVLCSVRGLFGRLHLCVARCGAWQEYMTLHPCTVWRGAYSAWQGYTTSPGIARSYVPSWAGLGWASSHAGHTQPLAGWGAGRAHTDATAMYSNPLFDTSNARMFGIARKPLCYCRCPACPCLPQYPR